MLAERLRESLATLDDVEVIATAVDESGAVAAAREMHLDVIILDLQLKEGTGFGVLQRLGKVRPIIIVFTNYMLPEYQRLANSHGRRALPQQVGRLRAAAAAHPGNRRRALKGDAPLFPCLVSLRKRCASPFKKKARVFRRGPW